ncbi:hypothetical protein ACHAXR_013132 [Thalassiosira sp. AJA248-18]
MAHIKDDTDSSVARDSVFDWGFKNKNADGDSVAGTEASAPSSRYDPKAMSRIVDITDLVDESSDGDSDDEMGHTPRPSNVSSITENINNGQFNKKKRHQYGPGGMGCRQVVILVSLVAIIAAASVAIGYAVMNVSPTTNPYRNGEQQPQQQQQLLEIAERVITACSESHLDRDMSECQELCFESGHMCCFESGEYSCENDEGKACAVYAGCEALVEGIPFDGADEDEE